MARIQHAQAVGGYKQMMAHDIHPKQIPVLLTLKDNEGISQNELAKRLHVKPPTIAVSVKRLRAAGFVAKQEDDNDARISHLYLTDKAKKVLEEIQNTFESAADSMLAGFAEEERAQLVSYLKRILENVGQLDTEGGQTCLSSGECDSFEENTAPETERGEEKK